MTRDVAFVRDTDTLAFASQVLLWRGIRHLPILSADDVIVGIVSDRDVLQQVIEGPAGARPISEFMSSPVATVDAGASLVEAIARLSGARVDALVVIEGVRLVGMITTSDLLAERGRSLRRASAGSMPRASDVMCRRVLVTHPKATLASAIEKLLAANIRHLPVVDDDQRIVGMLSDRDVRTAVGDPRGFLAKDGSFGGRLHDLSVENAMNRAPGTVGTNASVFELAALFVDDRIGALAVVRDDDTLVGIISYVDVIAHFVGRSAPQAANS